MTVAVSSPGEPLGAVTITLNPAIDLTVTLDGLVLGAVQLARAARSDAGGKGVNVAGCLADWGMRVAATGILGRANQSPFVEFFAAKGIADRFVRVAGETRTNVKLADLASGETTDINLPGLAASAAASDEVRAALAGLVRPGMPVALSGSLPASLPAATLGDIIGQLNRLGARVTLDSSGAPLAAALAAPPAGQPFAVKPNRRELEEWVGRHLPGPGDLVAAARTLIGRGVSLVVVSLGAEGAVFVDEREAIAARLAALDVLSTVGAGDAMVAGVIAGLAEAAPLERLARLGVAFATAKLGRIGPHLPSVAEVESLASTVVLAKAQAA